MIGSNLVRVLALMGDDVYVVDNLWRGKLDYLRDDDGKEIIDFKTRFYNRDLSIAGSCDDLVQKVDYVVHLADVVAGIDFVFDNQGLLFRQNILINSNVINSARKAKGHLKGFLYAGTAPSTYSNHMQTQVVQDTTLLPLTE